MFRRSRAVTATAAAAVVAFAASTLLLAGPAAAGDPTLTCTFASLQITLVHPRNTSGTMTFTDCTSNASPTIASGAATLTGVAGGAPEALMDTETVTVSWKDAGGTEVGTSTMRLIRALVGEEEAMVGHASGAVNGGLLAGTSVTQEVDQVSRACVTGTCTYRSITSHNQMLGY